MRACDYNSDPWSHVLRCNTRSPFSWLSAFFSLQRFIFGMNMKLWLWLLKGFMKMNSSTHVFHGREEHCWLPPSLCTSEKSRYQTKYFKSGRQEGTHYLLKTNDATIKKLTRAAYRLCRIQSPSHISEDETESFHYVSYSLQYDLVL